MLKSAMLSLCCALMLSGLAQASITVSGTGKVKYTPDIVYLNLGVSHEGKTAAEAWKLNADAVKKIFDALKTLGIPEKGLQTAGVNVNPRYVHIKDQEPRLVGYVATYDLNVTVRKLGEVGRVLDQAVEAGANRRVGIRFASSNPEKLIDQARLAAVTEARKKAKLYAEGAGASLGMVKTIVEGTYSPYREYRFDMPAKLEMGVRPLPIAAGEQELSITVTTTYELVHPTKG